MRIVGPLLEGPVSRRVYEGAAFVAVSPSTRRDMRRRLRLRGPIQVVPNGMTSIPGAARERSATPRITCVGRLVPHKRLELLLEALPQALAATPDLRVDLVGDGPERARLEELVAELALEDVVTFHGRVDDETRDRLLGAAWLTVQPSHHEGWGLTVLEANARGVPALAFRVPGLRDAVRPDTGWLVPEGGPLGPALVQALETLADPDAAAAIARRARAWAAGFSWEATAARLAALVVAERDRGTHAPLERRRPTDLVVQARVALPADAGAGAAVGRRRTDVWTIAGGEATALFYGADERDVQSALGRLGLEPTALEVARPIDLLASGAAGT
jgi:glycosyltransferase involved in cell wall biosynthesis